jgi:type VI secretion system protein ImpA
MTSDLDALLTPISDGSTGPDLAYDPDRHAIEQAFDVSVSIDASGNADASADVDWRAIIRAIKDQAGRTKDVWLAVYLARAGARAGDVGVVVLGLEYLAGLIEQYWAEVHPQLPEYGFQGRKGACDTLASYREFVGPLERIPLFHHDRHGSYTGADLQRFHRGGETEEGYGPFRAALADGGETALRAAGPRIAAIEAAVRRTDAVLVTEAGTESGTNFAPVYQLLTGISAAIRGFLPEPIIFEDEGPEPDEPEADVLAAGGKNVAAVIRNRDDVRHALDLLVDYYGRAEPSSPVPLLLARARAWVELSFIDVLGDIAPAALADARMLLETRGTS